MTSTRQQLQTSAAARAELFWNVHRYEFGLAGTTDTWSHSVLTLLFLPSFVTYGGSELQSGSVWQRAPPRTDHHTQTGLLQDLTVVVVGVPHGPARQMSLSVFIFSCKTKRLASSNLPSVQPLLKDCCVICGPRKRFNLSPAFCCHCCSFPWIQLVKVKTIKRWPKNCIY